jgi:hypothetical protein
MLEDVVTWVEQSDSAVTVDLAHHGTILETAWYEDVMVLFGCHCNYHCHFDHFSICADSGRYRFVTRFYAHDAVGNARFSRYDYYYKHWCHFSSRS